jgi:molybdopterin adenylyltransferase
MNLPGKFEILIITLSDRAFKGEYEDLSGPGIGKMISEYFSELKWEIGITQILIPDDAVKLKQTLLNDLEKYSFVFTTGGTGIGPRDITVETVKPMLNREIPGIMEYIRVKYGKEKPAALLSRGVAGVIGRTLIYTLPGSVRAVNEYMSEILKTLEHTIYMLYGMDIHK